MYKFGVSKIILVTMVLGFTINSGIFESEKLLTGLSVSASTVPTFTDTQNVVYTLDLTTQTATVSSFSGNAGTDIVIPDTIMSGGVSFPVVSIGSSAFLNAGIHSVVIGDNVTDINTSAFQCTSAFPDFYKKALVKVVLGKKVESIKTDAFAGNAISAIALPDSVTKIATRAFSNNFLTELSFSKNVTDVMSKAFQSNNLKKISFAPEATTLVGSAAFSGSPVVVLILGTGVVLADDTFNKISPLFGQMSDMPLTGVRSISVNSDGNLLKSWEQPVVVDNGTPPAEIQPETNQTEAAPVQDMPILPESPVVDSQNEESGDTQEIDNSGVLPVPILPISPTNPVSVPQNGEDGGSSVQILPISPANPAVVSQNSDSSAFPTQNSVISDKKGVEAPLTNLSAEKNALIISSGRMSSTAKIPQSKLIIPSSKTHFSIPKSTLKTPENLLTNLSVSQTISSARKNEPLTENSSISHPKLSKAKIESSKISQTKSEKSSSTPIIPVSISLTIGFVVGKILRKKQG